MDTTVAIRFYEELNDFLKGYPQKKEISSTYQGKRSVKDLIESFNIPHVEVDLILVNGEAVDFSYIPKTGDRISVYPVFESLNISGLTAPGGKHLRKPRFVLDVHLGKLARILRLLGFDADYRKDRDDPELADIACRENRILLTRDRGLLKRNIVDRGILIRSSDPDEQAVQVIKRLDIGSRAKPFTLCPACGGELKEVAKEGPALEECLKEVPPGVREWCREFSRCRRCGKLYWRGSHWTGLKERLDRLLEAGIKDGEL